MRSLIFFFPGLPALYATFPSFTLVFCHRTSLHPLRPCTRYLAFGYNSLIYPRFEHRFVLPTSPRRSIASRTPTRWRTRGGSEEDARERGEEPYYACAEKQWFICTLMDFKGAQCRITWKKCPGWYSSNCSVLLSVGPRVIRSANTHLILLPFLSFPFACSLVCVFRPSPDRETTNRADAPSFIFPFFANPYISPLAICRSCCVSLWPRQQTRESIGWAINFLSFVSQ